MHKLSEQAESLQNILVSQATGGIEDETEFTRLRKVILSQPALETCVPRFVKTCRSLGQFWQFIKSKFGTYAERRMYIWDEFRPMLEFLERGGAAPSDQAVSIAIKNFDSANIQAAWSKALDRRSSGSRSHVPAVHRRQC